MRYSYTIILGRTQLHKQKALPAASYNNSTTSGQPQKKKKKIMQIVAGVFVDKTLARSSVISGRLTTHCSADVCKIVFRLLTGGARGGLRSGTGYSARMFLLSPSSPATATVSCTSSECWCLQVIAVHGVYLSFFSPSFLRLFFAVDVVGERLQPITT